MKRYHENMPVNEESKQQVQFPVFRSFNNYITIVYKEKIKDSVFRAVTNDGQNVIVKFVNQYGKEAHDLCSHNRFAPHLLSISKVTLLLNCGHGRSEGCCSTAPILWLPP